MPRKAKFPPPVYAHKSGWDRIRVRGPSGKPRDIWLGPTGSEQSKKEYARIVAEIAATGQAPPPRQASEVYTVSDVVAAWWIMAEQTYSERGRELGNFRVSLNPLLRLYGHTKAAAFDANALEVVQLAMASGSWMNDQERERAGKQGQPIGWCANVVNRRIVRIRTVWRWAERKKMVPGGAWNHLITLPGLGANHRAARHTEEVKPATWSEVMAVVRSAHARPRSRRIAAMLLLQWWSGMRSCEVRLMRVCDIDRSDPSCWLFRPAEHKNDWRPGEEPRVVPLGRKCQAVLTPWLEGRSPDAYLFAPIKGRPKVPYRSYTYAQAVRRAAERAGVPDLTAYRCRHAAKRRITAAMGLDAARAVLGQRSLGTTNQYAAQLDLNTVRAAARRLA